MATVTYSYREVCQWALVCRLNKTKFAEIFEETLKQNSPDSETSNTFRVRHIIWQTQGAFLSINIVNFFQQLGFVHISCSNFP